MFPRIPYLHWIEGRPETATYDLGSSGLRAGPEPPGTVVPDTLTDLPDPPAEVRLEEQLATVYGVDPANVIVTAGASAANLVAAAAAIRGEESRQILVEKPGYQPLIKTPQGFGARVDRFRRLEEEEYRLDPDRVEAALIDEPALVTVTNRHNPSGRLTNRETLAETARRTVDAGGRLLVDEVYGPYAVVEGGAFGGVTAADLPGVVVTGSLTKFYGLRGLRIGWIVADREFIAAAREVEKHVPSPADPSVALARRALAARDQLTAEAQETVTANHERLRDFVEERDDLYGEVYPGSPYAFVRHEQTDGDAVAAAAWDRGVLVVPGRFFEDDDRFRIGLGRSPETVEEGLAVFGEVLDSL